MMSRITAFASLLALCALLGCGTEERGADEPADEPDAARAAPPKPDEGIPLRPDRLAERLSRTRADLHRAIEDWLAAGGRREPTPRDVTLYALHHQRIFVLLSPRERLARSVLDRLRGTTADEARDILAARRELGSLSTPVPLRRFRTGPALPARVLLRYYRKAERRFDVSWKVLAAVNFVESAFGRLRNNSTAGAQGPMQFIPSTWAAYGMGGDVEDPHDAIMGAANYLRASVRPRTTGWRFTPTTRPRRTSTRCSATHAGSGPTPAPTSPSTAGRCSSTRRRGSAGSPAPDSGADYRCEVGCARNRRRRFG